MRRAFCRERLPGVLAGTILSLLCAPDAGAQWSASVLAEGSAFSQGGSASDYLPGATEALITLDATWSKEWDQGRYLVSASPLLRLDPSGERSRFDFVDLSASLIRDRWELAIGMREVAWGAVESRRLVDGVNQRDLVGGGDGFLRMAQLMADATVFGPWGAVDVMLLPWFRKRRFDGRSGQLWSPLPVDDGRAGFESGAGSGHLDWAVRWSRTFGPVDLGVSHLQGTLREPRFVTATDGEGIAVLTPFYDLGSQTGIDAQAVTGRWVWKLEALTATPETGRYLAAVGGVELGVGDFLGLFLEYAWDSRGAEATTSFGSDLFAGGRLFLPDGQVRLGGFVDTESFNTAIAADVEWRLGSAMTIGVEMRAFLGDESLEPAYARRQRTCITLQLSRYF
jgi:hypothetical protein